MPDEVRWSKDDTDEVRPICGQGRSTLRSEHQYSEVNKRGIPSGYINGLEGRRLETRTALLDAPAPLKSYNSLKSSSISTVQALEEPAAKAKNDYLEEGRSYPLEKLDDCIASKRDAALTGLD